MPIETRKQKLPPNVYAVIVTNTYGHLKQMQMGMYVDYSLDNAIIKAKEDLLATLNRNGVPIGIVEVEGHAWMPVAEIIDKYSETKPMNLEIAPPEMDDKNTLINRIITLNDKDLYFKNLSKFNEAERKYINDKLK